MTDLSFLITRWVRQSQPQVRQAIAVSADGLLLACNEGLPRDHADRLAAVASGLAGLLRSAGAMLHAGAVTSNMTQYQDGFVLTMSIPSPTVDGASLLVLADPGCDIGAVSHGMAELINQVGHALTPDVRPMEAEPVGGYR